MKFADEKHNEKLIRKSATVDPRIPNGGVSESCRSWENSASGVNPGQQTKQEHKPQRSCSKNQQFVSQVRAVVDAGLDEQFMSGNPIVFSELLSKEFQQEYSLMNALFYQIQDCTLEEYILSRKMEKVKEGLVYTDRSLSEIARALGFGNVQRLDRELSRHTGYAPDYYLKIRQEKLLVMCQKNKIK